MPCTYCHDPNCNESPPKTLTAREERTCVKRARRYAKQVNTWQDYIILMDARVEYELLCAQGYR